MSNVTRADSSLVRRFMVPRQSIKERYAAGKALRDRLPRRIHGDWGPPRERADPVSVLESQAKSRLPELIPVRYARMLQSPFAFFRGAAAIMAADLAETKTTGLLVQACGDLHVSNFGVFASAERRLTFGINDFDETLVAAWEWDLKRLAASAALCARDLKGDRSDQEAAARATLEGYREHIHEYSEMGFMEVWYATIDEQSILNVISPDTRQRVGAVFKRARKRNHLQVLEKMTELVDDRCRILDEPPLIFHVETIASGRPSREALGMFLEVYLESLADDRRELLSRYQVVDVARKVVGVGSVGTHCWVVFLQGAHSTDPLFLQVKEAQPSALKPYFPQPRTHLNEGHRVVMGQRLIQGSPDIFLGWGELDGFQFYVRQLRDMKGGVELIPGKTKINNFIEHCRLCGWATALAHAKSGDAAMIAGYIGKSKVFEQAFGRFALRYIDQVDEDYDRFAAAARDGSIQVAELV